MQQALVIAIVAACVVWLGVLGYRYFRPKPGATGCPGGCCGGEEKKPDPEQEAPAPRMQMISSDDMRARLKARQG
jgi:hypothetical protein